MMDLLGVVYTVIWVSTIRGEVHPGPLCRREERGYINGVDGGVVELSSKKKSRPEAGISGRDWV
jgi:hypothetical protein